MWFTACSEEIIGGNDEYRAHSVPKIESSDTSTARNVANRRLAQAESHGRAKQINTEGAARGSQKYHRIPGVKAGTDLLLRQACTQADS